MWQSADPTKQAMIFQVKEEPVDVVDEVIAMEFRFFRASHPKLLHSLRAGPAQQDLSVEGCLAVR